MRDSEPAASLEFVRWVTSPRARVAITGASGWVGSGLIHYALAAGLTPDRLTLLGSRPRPLKIAGVVLEVRAMDEAMSLIAAADDADWILVHAAIAGPDRIPGGDLDRTRAVNDHILQQIIAVAAQTSLRRLVFTSSGAALQANGAALSPPRRAYAAMKAAHEAVVRDWSEAAGGPLLIARLFNLGGPYIHPVNQYALGDFIDAVLAGRPIVIAAERPTFRSYVHLFDLARAIFDASLQDGARVDLFETAGAETVELAELATRVVRVLGRPDFEIQRSAPHGPADRYVGDGARWRALLASPGAPPAGLDDIIIDTARFLSLRQA